MPDITLSDLKSGQIDFADIKIEKELGKGGFGVIYKVRIRELCVQL
jgi:predicted Ser/Thr protein kinase